MPNFKTALDSRPASDQASLQPKLLAWHSLSSDDKRLVENLYKEHFAPVAVMDAFITDILGFAHLPVPVFKKNVVLSYDQHTGTGDIATLEAGIRTLGFSLTTFFINKIIELYYLDDFGQDLALVSEFLSKKSVGTSDDDYDGLSIKGPNSTIWVTWSTSSDNPFDFMHHNCCTQVYNALALTNWYNTGPIFLFRTSKNKIESKAVLLRPTVFDAGEHAPFLPADLSFADHGFTDPYNNGILCIHGLPAYSSPRPEAIVDGSEICWKDIDIYNELK